MALKAQVKPYELLQQSTFDFGPHGISLNEWTPDPCLINWASTAQYPPKKSLIVNIDPCLQE